MGAKFIPNGDVDFAVMARNFAGAIAKDAARFAVAQDDAEALSAAVEAYGKALDAVRTGGGRSPITTRIKDDARAEAERQIRRLANIIRHNENVDTKAKLLLNLRERPSRATVKPCPPEPPRLKFVRALHEGNGAQPMHELQFQEFHTYARTKPAGAVRIELFVDLVPPDEPIPARPGANHGGRPWYLRSYTRNPIIVAPPMARVPMRVVYWGRWADSSGDVGPFSATAVAWIEGASHYMLPGGIMGAPGAPSQPHLFEHAAALGPEGRNQTYRVAIRAAQYEALNAPHVTPALPAPSEPPQRQLEGPAVEEAA